MINNLENYKDQIPEFVFKLHHILENKDYKQFITWASDGTQIVVKHSKKLEDKVLPYFFRHKHISSFIRQLNMYKFNKVNKISKQRSHMYFKNQHFKRGEFEQMKLIKRAQRLKKVQLNQGEIDNDEKNMIEHSVHSDLTSFKTQSQVRFAQIEQIVNNIIRKRPELQGELTQVLQICENMKGGSNPMLSMAYSSINNFFPEGEVQNQPNNRNMILATTHRDLPLIMNSMIYPSMCSLTNLDSLG